MRQLNTLLVTLEFFDHQPPKRKWLIHFEQRGSGGQGHIRARDIATHLIRDKESLILCMACLAVNAAWPPNRANRGIARTSMLYNTFVRGYLPSQSR
jgi:hypothetical protein